MLTVVVPTIGAAFAPDVQALVVWRFSVLPVATTFRRAHLVDPEHPCYAGDLGIGNRAGSPA